MNRKLRTDERAGKTEMGADLNGDTESKPRTFDSRDLLDKGREAFIEHEGKKYRLQATRNGKLILTK